MHCKRYANSCPFRLRDSYCQPSTEKFMVKKTGKLPASIAGGNLADIISQLNTPKSLLIAPC